MRKSGGAVIRMKTDKVRYLVGSDKIVVRPRVPFDEQICDFLDAFSKEILKDVALKSYADVVSFAFWIRKANIQKQKKEQEVSYLRLGRGLAFHIAPSNVPINAMFTFVFGLLSGNSNIVRVSSKDFPQVKLLCDKLNVVLKKEEYKQIKEENAIIQYERDAEITDYYSLMADVRVIWGGDRTIAEIRKSPLKPRSKDIVFADRYSFGIITPEYVLGLTEEKLKSLARDFYNDTYLMDQNACSTPHMLFWLSQDTTLEKQAQDLFWKQVCIEAKRYALEDIKVSEKYTNLCLYAIKNKKFVGQGKISVTRYDNLLYVMEEKEVPKELSKKRGKFGMFYQCSIADLDTLKSVIDVKVQTVAVAGLEKSMVQKWIVENRLLGIDRIVSFGHTLDIGLIWDGYNFISEMSRIIACN